MKNEISSLANSKLRHALMDRLERLKKEIKAGGKIAELGCKLSNPSPKIELCHTVLRSG